MSTKKNAAEKKDYTVSVQIDGVWKLIDMDNLPITEADWLAHFEKRKAKTKTIKEFLKYPFTHEEIHQKGGELARINSELMAIESEAKASASNFKAKKDVKLSEIEVLSNHINSGFEHRYIPCIIIFNSPNSGMKQLVRKDSGEIIKTESMTSDELQTKLFDETPTTEEESIKS